MSFIHLLRCISKWLWFYFITAFNENQNGNNSLVILHPYALLCLLSFDFLLLFCCLETRKVSPPVVVKEDRPVANQTPVEIAAKEPDVGKSPHDAEANTSKARTFTFANLVAATQSFKEENFLGEGGFGKVYRGLLPETGEVSYIYIHLPNGYLQEKLFVICFVWNI